MGKTNSKDLLSKDSGKPWKSPVFNKPGALLGVVGGSGVLKGSKGTGSKSKEVVFEGVFGVIEVVLLARLEL